VTRSRCRGGIGRATNATLTDSGHDKVASAAADHIRTVRELLIDPLSATQLDELTAIGRLVRDRLDPSAATFGHLPGEDR